MRPPTGHLQLQARTAAHLNVMYAELLKTANHTACCKKKRPCGSHLGTTGLSKTTVRAYHATLSSWVPQLVGRRSCRFLGVTCRIGPSAGRWACAYACERRL